LSILLGILLTFLITVLVTPFLIIIVAIFLITYGQVKNVRLAGLIIWQSLRFKAHRTDYQDQANYFFNHLLAAQFNCHLVINSSTAELTINQQATSKALPKDMISNWLINLINFRHQPMTVTNCLFNQLNPGTTLVDQIFFSKLFQELKLNNIKLPEALYILNIWSF